MNVRGISSRHETSSSSSFFSLAQGSCVRLAVGKRSKRAVEGCGRRTKEEKRRSVGGSAHNYVRGLLNGIINGNLMGVLASAQPRLETVLLRRIFLKTYRFRAGRLLGYASDFEEYGYV
ncbi:hypothetical protein KM043_014791 [Ampulex compressa]|nr:hypothetical protein KM043_014791 [Ampulex compressa]